MTERPDTAGRTSAAEACRETKVRNRFGIHARPAALIVKTASGFQAEVYLEKDSVRVSAKSIMGLLTLEGHPGSVFRVLASGADAAEAVAAVTELFEKNFYEE